MGNYVLAEENLRRAAEKENDPTVLDHLGDLFQRTDRLKLAAASWERGPSAMEQNRSRRNRAERCGEGSKETRRHPREIAKESSSPAK